MLLAEKVFSFLSKDEVEKLRQEEERKIATLRRDKKSRLLDAANDNIDKDDVARHADKTSTSTSRQQQQQQDSKNSNSSDEADQDEELKQQDNEEQELEQHRQDVVDNAAMRAQFEDAEDIR